MGETDAERVNQEPTGTRLVVGTDTYLMHGLVDRLPFRVPAGSSPTMEDRRFVPHASWSSVRLEMTKGWPSSIALKLVAQVKVRLRTSQSFASIAPL
jgi:hypothetical protein